jgi:hypothetical protein
MGACSRTPSGPAVSIDCINRPDRRLHPTYANTPNFPLQRGSHPQRTSSCRPGMSALCHVWTAPGWQELSSRTQAWSVLPCVRPFSAVHMTAGHNTLRGSGPSQKHAFDDAMAQVGCPDRRIDRSCIMCCSLSQPFTSRRLSGAISFTAQALRVACSARPWPSWPRPSAQSC